MLALEPGAPQLFVDDHLIERSRGLRRTLHRPVKDGGGLEPVIALGDEYGDLGATLEANGTIVWDPRLERWVMFALALASARRGPDRARLYRFTSRDGIAWTKGADGRPEQIVFDLTDPRTGASATGIDLFACHYDASEERHPYRGWLYNWGRPLEGVYFVRSPDGRAWERGRRVAAAESRWLVQDGRVLHGPGDVTTFSPDRDPDTGRHLALLKFFSPRPVEHRSRLRSRAFMWVERLDEAIDLDRLERVDLVPPAAAGTIETPALTLPGGGLRVNAVGPVTVELVGAAGETLGTSRVDGDSVRHAVRLPAPEGAARLRFAVEPGGRLYSFSAG